MSIVEKYVYGNIEEEKVKHWNECEKHKVPFISVEDKNKVEVEIFYDITNIASSDELQNISDKIKKFYTSYLEFQHLEMSSVQEYFDDYYFFRFKVKKEFYPILTEKLFDFLFEELK